VKEQEDLFSCSFLFHICPTKTISMKQKFLLNCILVIGFSSSAFAQFQKGDKVLGLGFSISTSKTQQSGGQESSYSAGSYGLRTLLGFAVHEHRLHGFYVNGNYGTTKQEFSNQPTANTKSKNYNVGLGYFTTIYKPLGKSFFVFGEANAGVIFSEQEQTPFVVEQKQYGASITLYPGIAYQWNKRLLLEARFGDFITAGFGRNESKSANNDKMVTNSFSLNSSLGLGYLQNFGIGARWIIPSKKKAQ
jgi:hypothetical protein